MKKAFLTIVLFYITFSTLFSQTYTTPNTGVNWTLDDIAAASPTTITISGSDYSLLENLVIAANDTVTIDTDLTLSIDSGLLITVFGTFVVDSDSVTITAIDPVTPYEGFRFEEFSEINIQNTTIEFGGGLRVLTETFSLNNCLISENVEGGATTGAVISLSRGIPQITNNTITFNELPAIASAANQSVSAYIFNNYIEGNNQVNSNRPQINMGATRVMDTLKIIQNTIIGDSNLDLVGGIAVANLAGGTVRVIIDENTIQNNRYGLTVVGPDSFAYIRDNIIEDNNTQNIPLQGGSGISLNTSSGVMEVIASGNEIRRNLWGITVIGTASINLGDELDNVGENVFSENGNEGELYALYNNTTNTLFAKNNCWIEGQDNTSADAEIVIFHQTDDGSLGEVIFDPVGEDCGGLTVGEFLGENFSFYPNPAKHVLNITSSMELIESIIIYDMQGREVKQWIGETVSQVQLDLSDLKTSIYLIKITTPQGNLTKRLLKL